MLDELRAMAVFAKTVETGSFRAAATALGLSPSVVSHHVAQLEARLGVALLYRSTRKLSLTQDGAVLFEHASTLLQSAEQGLNAITQRTDEAVGKLTITLPAFLARGALQSQLAAFALAYLKVSLVLDFSDLKRDLIRDGVDLAIRVGELQDSGLKSRRLFDLERRLVCAPSLACQFAQPSRPEDLAAWPWIGLHMRPNHRELVNAQGERRRIAFDPRITVNSVDALGQMALAGLGLAMPPAFLVEDDIGNGRLQQVLPDWQVPALGVYALWPANAPREGLTGRAVQFVADRLAHLQK